MPTPTGEGRSWWARALSFTWEKVIVVFVVALAVALLAPLLIRHYWPESDSSVGSADETPKMTAVRTVMAAGGVPTTEDAATKVRCRNASGMSARSDARQCLVYADEVHDVALVKDPCFVSSEDLVDCVFWKIPEFEFSHQIYRYEEVSPWWGEAVGEPGELVGIDTAIREGSPWLLLVSFEDGDYTCVDTRYQRDYRDADQDQYVCTSSPDQDIAPNQLEATSNPQGFIDGSDRGVTSVGSQRGQLFEGFAFALDRNSEPWTISFSPRKGANADRSIIVAAYF